MPTPRRLLHDTHAVNAAATHNRQREVVIEDEVVTNPCNGEDVLLHIDQLFLLAR